MPPAIKSFTASRITTCYLTNSLPFVLFFSITAASTIDDSELSELLR